MPNQFCNILPPYLSRDCGPDQLTNEYLKFGSSLLPVILSTLFNAILLSGHIPAPFKHGLYLSIPKGHNKDMSVPSNYSLLSVIGNVFEKVLLLHLSEQQAQLNPLQGGFRAGFSCLHSAFIFQEAVSSMREQKKKVFVACVKKAFDTVWHAGLMVKLFQKNVALYIWHIINNWYSGSTSSVLWNLSVSRSFRIQQGVHQGSILYPLLYSTFVNELLDRLRASGYGVYIDDIYCGAPMYADDLTHFCIRPSTPARHGFCFYAFRWRYQLNAQKSSILVFGKSPISWKQNRTNRKWLLSGTVIPERNTQHHLGILHRTVHSSSISRTIEHCSAGKSAFFAVGSMFGCLHPTTSFRLYFSFCISI